MNRPDSQSHCDSGRKRPIRTRKTQRQSRAVIPAQAIGLGNDAKRSGRGLKARNIGSDLPSYDYPSRALLHKIKSILRTIKGNQLTASAITAFHHKKGANW